MSNREKLWVPFGYTKQEGLHPDIVFSAPWSSRTKWYMIHCIAVDFEIKPFRGAWSNIWRRDNVCRAFRLGSPFELDETD